MSGRTARGTMMSNLGTRQVCASARTEAARQSSGPKSDPGAAETKSPFRIAASPGP